MTNNYVYSLFIRIPQVADCGMDECIFEKKNTKDINQEPGGIHMAWLWLSDRSFTGIFREAEMCPFFPPP